MAIGRVKWYLDAKGFGFIIPDHGGQEIFFGFNAIQVDGFKTVAEGQKVEFDVALGPKGPYAQNVRPIA
jgi:CspA family cold shock protein